MPSTERLAPPDVSIIVPARNEESSLAACLQSLLAQTGVPFEVIVVDDHSTDRTPEIAQSFSSQGVGLIDAPELPQGWTGKNNALVSGVKIARGNWFLFTDADTIHLPGSLARALDEAGRRKADMLSYSPQQIVGTFWEKSVMPVIFAELAAIYRPSQVSNPNSASSAANGQYILIRREVYDAVGGHAAIADQILEDVALARAVKRSGRRIFFRYAADAVRTRMYRNFAQIREGWTKNLALLFPSPRRLAVIRLLEFLLIVGSFAVTAAEFLRGRSASATATGLAGLLLYSAFLARIRRAHFHWDSNLLSLFGLPIFSYLLLRAQGFHERGTVSWKGRIYSKSATKTPSKPQVDSSPCHSEQSEESRFDPQPITDH
jgi:glycosyltransferase involved in cell wall biosynthesis